MVPIATRFRGILKAAQNSGGTPTDMRLIRRLKGVAWTVFIISFLMAFRGSTALAQDPPGERPVASSSSAKVANRKSSDTFTLVGAGDIVGCSDLSGARATAKLIDAIPGTVFAAGDLAYQHGTYEEFLKCYGPTWGRFKARTRPTPGNHEYNGSTATGYFRYWGSRAGEQEKGYYSFDLGAWHLVVLNTSCESSRL